MRCIDRPCLASLVFIIAGCSSAPNAQATLTTLAGTQGGTIVYGAVDGATTPAAALGSVLRSVHSNCGEKPRVGSVFRVRGTNSDAIFFTVVDHPHGNRQAAGMIIAAQTGPQTVEAAMVTDDAARFSSTVNPLLAQLFGVWHPGGTSGSMLEVDGGTGGVRPAPQVTLSDQTATLSLPAGWKLDPNSTRGFAAVNGPQGEDVVLDFLFAALDPQGQTYKMITRWGAPPPTYIISPSDVDLIKSFVDVWQKLRAVNKMAPAPMNIANLQPLSAPPLGQCVDASGQLDPDGKGMKELRALLCKMAPDQNGAYGFMLSLYRLPLGSTDQQRATASGIMASYKVNVHRVLELTQAAEDAIEAQEATLKPMGQQAINAMHRSDTNAPEAARAAQWSRFNQLENTLFRPPGFSDYLLDQSVLQNNLGGAGTVGHATMWNSMADALVRSDPNRYEIVNIPNYWSGVDF